MLNDYFLKGKINVFRKKFLYYAAGTFGAAPLKKIQKTTSQNLTYFGL